MLIAALRDMQWRRRRLVIAIISTGLVFAMTLVLTGLTNGRCGRAVPRFDTVRPGRRGAGGRRARSGGRGPAGDGGLDHQGRRLGAKYHGGVLFEQCTMGDLIYVVSEGEFDIVRELADGGEELVKVAGPGDYFGEMGVLFHMPRSATVRARTDATAVGYTAQAFRERLGAAGISGVVGQHELARADG